jgi:transposase
MEFLDALTKIVEVKLPWKINEVVLNEPTKSVNIFIEFEKGSKFECPVCQQESPVYDSAYRVWRHLDICDYRCYLNIKIPRVTCKTHGTKVIQTIPFGRMDTHYSFKFEKMFLAKAKQMSVSAIASELGESDSNLWRVFHHYVEKEKKNIDCSETKIVGVDEKSFKKGHSYVSIFTDHDNGNVIFSTPGRDEKVFELFYSQLFEMISDPNYIEKLSMDMSKSYISGANHFFPHCEQIFDRFHIKKALNEKIDIIRRQEVKKNEKLKKTRYIWLKNQCNLTEKQKGQLDDFLKDTTNNLVKAYTLKIEFDQLWNVQQNAVEPLLDKWLDKAKSLNLQPVNDFIKTLLNHKTGILNSMKTFITNAVSEGLNSVFQLAKHRARGFRNINNFINMIYFLGNDFKFTHTN